MNDSIISIALRCASITALATAGWWFVADLTAPDTCLDTGGAFDYARWLCSFDDRENLVHIDVPITALPSFPVFCGCALVFAMLQLIAAKSPGRRHRHSSEARD